jgi:hypothetical protein
LKEEKREGSKGSTGAVVVDRFAQHRRVRKEQ